MNRQQNRGHKGSNTRTGSNFQDTAVNHLTNRRFEEAKAKIQESVQKHIVVESSDDDSDVESAPLLGQVLKSYTKSGGKEEDLGRTQAFLENSLRSGAATCLICIATVKRTDPIWSCVECFCFFHLVCIQRWATDSITHRKQNQLDVGNSLDIFWTCPNCRHDYVQKEIPKDYFCFCGKTKNPTFQIWQIPHSCDAICSRALQPLCGHSCLLCCHPGPCPPCPKTVQSSCFCGKSPARLQRCSNKNWSCGEICRQKLSCGLHTCNKVCHSGDCAPCAKTSIQYCECRSKKELRPCADPVWQCKKACGKRLNCTYHVCDRVCHSGDCGPCPRTEPRACPCGKTLHILPCVEEPPVCGDTCGQLLDCGQHTCSRPCHKDKCGTCLEVAIKSCRCGLHKKELPCKKEYLCETKCKKMKDCIRHPCNRKCCDGNCPPCEKLCGRTLGCGSHKCTAVCHYGPCYPCPITVEVKCNCGETSISVPCGRHKKTKPPRCNKPCSVEPDCHHSIRDFHKCHFGACPPCKQVCNKTRNSCSHLCPAPCHSAVWVAVTDNHKPAGPWEKTAPQLQLQSLPCPDCVVPVPVTCIGGHDTSDWPCHLATPSSCHRPCGRPLLCQNHYCTLPCHSVTDIQDFTKADDNCEVCESGCTKPRPEGCTHICPKPCHQELCPPCTNHLRIRCHCTLNQLYILCGEWTSANDIEKEALQSCKNQCPKSYECGHRCFSVCHPGACPNPENCRKKVKIYCPCHRLRKEFPCNVSKISSVQCDDVCKQKLAEEMKVKEEERKKKQLEEERKNQEEVERFERRLQHRRKHKDWRHKNEGNTASSFNIYHYILVTLFSVICGLILYFIRSY